MIKAKIKLIILLLVLIFSVKFVSGLTIHNKSEPSQLNKSVETSSDISSKPVSQGFNASEKKSNIIIDPGHGGNDLGAVSGNLYEKDINLYIAKRLKDFLMKDNYSVAMTRERDEFLASRSMIAGTMEKKDLEARTRFINSSNALLFVSIHVDSLPSEPAKNGSTVYYNPEIKASKILAEYIQTELNQVKLNNKNRMSGSPSTANFYLLKNSEIPGVLVETGFITNKAEKSSFSQGAFKDDLAKAIYIAIEKYSSKYD